MRLGRHHCRAKKQQVEKPATFIGSCGRYFFYLELFILNSPMTRI